MAEPSAVVVRTFKPQGDLQLHRFYKRVRFHCVHCQKDKTADLVATMGGDWAQRVCQQCYGFLVHEQRKQAKEAKTAKEKARKTAKGEARRSAMAKRQAAEARAQCQRL